MTVTNIGSELELMINAAIDDIRLNIAEIVKHAMDRNVIDNNTPRRFLELVLLLYRDEMS